MRSSILKCFAAALVVAAVLVPSATATSHSPTLKLALVPLRKAQLGAAAAGLKLTSGSGSLPEGPGVAVYQLDYGYIFLARRGLDEVLTSVTRYRTAHAAKRGLMTDKKEAFGSLDIFPGRSQLKMTFNARPLAVPGLGHSHWALLQAFSVAHCCSAYVVDIEFRDGKYVLHSFAIAGSRALATSYAAAKARLLDRRLHLGLNGSLHGHPLAVPKDADSGPPPRGTDPATAVLQTSDLTGSKIAFKGYASLDGALSEYGVEFHPAGSFGRAEQTVSLMPSAASAAFSAAELGALELDDFSQHPSGTVTPVDVSAAGDNAQAAIFSSSGKHRAVVTLQRGALADVVVAKSPTTIHGSAVRALAQAAATRLDAAVGP